MPSFKTSFKTIVSKGDLDNVITYTPKKIESTLSFAAKDFVRTEQDKKNPFRIDKMVADQTQISNLENQSIEDKVQDAVIDKVKEIEEEAYSKAYVLGREDGRQEAFRDHTDDIKIQLEKMGSLLQKIEGLKRELIKFNETHIVTTIFALAQKIAQFEIEKNPDRILPILKDAIEMAQADENVVIRMNAEDMQHIQSMREEVQKEIPKLSRVRLEESMGLEPGSCIVETNFGVIDGRISERIDKLWCAIAENTPKVKNKISQ